MANLTKTQHQVNALVKEICDEYTGTRENTMLDYDEQSNEYKEAERDLYSSRENLVNALFNEVTTSREWRLNDYLHVVTLEYVRQQVEQYVINEGY